MEKPDFTTQILLLGDSGVGKTAIITRSVQNAFSPQVAATIGIDYKTRNIKIEGVEAKLWIWDSAGANAFQHLAQTSSKNKMGIVFVFDLTDRSSFDNIKKWAELIKGHTKGDVCKMLLGNKCDSTKKVITADEIKELAGELNVSYFNVSALTGENINEAFTFITKNIKKTFFPTIKPDEKKKSITQKSNPRKSNNLNDETGVSGGCNLF